VRDALAKKLQFSVEEQSSRGVFGSLVSEMSALPVGIAAQTLDEAVVKVQAAFRGFLARATSTSTSTEASWIASGAT